MVAGHSNIKAAIEGSAIRKATERICLADMGDTGVAFVAVPQLPPRNITWAKRQMGACRQARI